MARVFISNIDSPIGHNLSRLFTNTKVGSRKEEEPEEVENPVEGEEPTTTQIEKPPKETYTVCGTLTQELLNKNNNGFQLKTLPGPMSYTGDRRVDVARKEAIEKFAVLGQKPGWVTDVVQNVDKKKLKESLMSSDVIVYDLTQNVEEAIWAIEMLFEAMENYTGKPKVFIGVSTVMTWARTKVDPEDPEAFLSEDEYKRRKAHPNFKRQIEAEKIVMKCGSKAGLKTYIVASGLVYHSGDSIFHYLLKNAWQNQQELLCFGEGNNILPIIHVDDLTNILVEIVETTPEIRYILAVDESKNSLYEITKAISEALGTGKVKRIPKEDALLNKSITQSEYDMLLVNLRIDPGIVKEMTFEWKYEQGVIENLPTIVQEYKNARGLLPLKVMVHGPPGCGKSILSKKLAAFYEVSYIDVDQLVDETMKRLEASVSKLQNPAEEEEEVRESLEADKELWDTIQEELKSLTPIPVPGTATTTNVNSKIPIEYIVQFVKEKLKSPACKNQGYILEGFPTTLEQASKLFSASSDGEDAKDGGNALTPMDELLSPEFVISLEASDESIKERIMNLPESVTAGAPNSEEAFIKRLEDFRNINQDMTTVLNYFDEHEIHPFIIQLECDDIQIIIDKAFNQAKSKIGGPRNYGLTAEQLELNFRVEKERLEKEAAIQNEENIKKEREEIERHTKAVSEWNTRLQEIRTQEQQVLEVQSFPLRNYLMKHVMPTLTSGLIEVCKARPDDPVDYLAEYLFRKNPANFQHEGLGM